MTCNWCLTLPLEITFEIIGSTPTKTIKRVCISNSLKERICLLCTEVIREEDFRRKLMILGGQKETKALFESSLRSSHAT